MTDVQAGFLPTALFISAVTTMLATASLADRIGAKPMNVLGVGFSLASNLLFAAGPTYETLLVAKAVGGIGSGLAFLGGVRYIAGLYPGARSHFGQGVYGAGYPLGSALGLQLMPPLALVFGGWRGAFVASSTLLAAVLVLYAWRAPIVPRAALPGTIRDALRNGNSWWCFVQHAAGFGLALAAGSWISVYILREFDTSLVVAGALGAFILIAGLFMRPLGGWLVARRHATTVALMRGSQVLNLVGLALLAIPGRPLAVALVGGIAVGVGVSLPYAAVFNTAAASLPRAPGAAQSLTATGGTFGAVVGAPIMGVAIERFGFSAAWTVIAIVPLAALVGTFFIRGEEDLDRPP
ncbi:MAG: MFS transporter [Chloroflexota bacterium]|nr:MFS transporter [Chloroflexota bacterium]